MDLSTLLLYLLAVSAVMMTPGPSMLLALSNGASKGLRVAGYGMAGGMLSDLILVGAVGCGLGALLQASEQLFSVVKWLGAAYLLYLAWGLWRSPTQALAERQVESAATGWAAFRRALLVGLSNPKGLLFFAAFLPQFIHPDAPLAPQYIVLAVTSAVVDLAMMMLYAVGGRLAMQRFSSRAMQWLNRSCAGVMGVLALGLTVYKRHSPH